MKKLGQVFDSWVTKAAAVVFVLIVALVIFNVYSRLPGEDPVFGVILFSAVPILFVAGGLIFILAIVKGPPARFKLFFLMSVGAIGIIFLVIGSYQLIDFTDTAGFCGRLCHNVMYPEYTVYQASPHSRVPCADCHVGPGANYLIKSKLAGVPLIFSTITGKYDRPIPVPVHSLRPARETCEQCHRPERFTGDLVVQNTTYATDEFNTPSTNTLVLRVGGGQSGLAQGIHWHISSTVYYLALDNDRQDIAWVRVETQDGPVDYISPSEASQVTPERIQNGQRVMDCVDCHNRATHQFKSPETLLDNAFSQGQLDANMPYLNREAIQALDPPSSSLKEAYARIDAITGFYQTNYPNLYRDNQADLASVIAKLKNIAVLTTFPDMHVTWKTYVDNIGHIDSPGCFRCHGKLVAQNGPQKGQVLSASCTLCHYSLQQGLPQ